MIIDPTHAPDPEGPVPFPQGERWTTMVAGELGFHAFPDCFGVIFAGSPSRKDRTDVAVTVFIEPDAYAAAADYLETVVAELRARVQ